MDEFQIIEKLQKHLRTPEVYHVIRFNCDRTTNKGTHQEVEIEILDRGPADPNRYYVRATADDGKTAAGNAGPVLETVLDFVHWYDLD